MLKRKICPSKLLQWRDWECATGGSPNSTLLASLTGQKCEIETEINICPHSHRQVFTLLYHHLNTLAPHTTAKLWRGTGGCSGRARWACSFIHSWCCRTMSGFSRMAGSLTSNSENTSHLPGFYQPTPSWPVSYISFSREKEELR